MLERHGALTGPGGGSTFRIACVSWVVLDDPGTLPRLRAEARRKRRPCCARLRAVDVIAPPAGTLNLLRSQSLDDHHGSVAKRAGPRRAIR